MELGTVRFLWPDQSSVEFKRCNYMDVRMLRVPVDSTCRLDVPSALGHEIIYVDAVFLS